MSLAEISNVVLLFSNPLFRGHTGEQSTVVKNITALSSRMAYSARVSDNLITLASEYVTSSQTIQGLLYFPDLASSTDPCQPEIRKYVSPSAVRRANLPPTTFNLVALAPWINAKCTQALLASARDDPLRAFIFYQPNNGTGQPPPASSDVWDLGDDDAWKLQNRFPVFAIPGRTGADMMYQLSLYSGNITTVPFGETISALYDPSEEDYVRIWTQLTVSVDSSLASMWVMVPAILGVLLSVILATLLFRHIVRRHSRAALRRRVESGDVNLEALGIKRLTVPLDHVQTFPLFTYSYDPHVLSSLPGALATAVADHIEGLNPKSPTETIITHASSSAQACGGDLEKQMSAYGGQNLGPGPGLGYQPMCLICLEAFDDLETVIRELPCGHIFHPECIDECLTQASSLCPLCKASMLPKGYCPRITNEMVRREMATRKLRGRIFLDREANIDDDAMSVHSNGDGMRVLSGVTPTKRIGSWGSSVKRNVLLNTSSLTLQERQQQTGRMFEDLPPPRQSEKKSRPWTQHLGMRHYEQQPLRRSSPTERVRQRMRELAGPDPDEHPSRFCEFIPI